MNTRHLHLKKYLQGSPEAKAKAVALRYDPDKESAPRVVASGQGRVAERILEIARKNQIPLMEDTLLTESLLCLDLEQEIPPELYTIVAEVLAYIYRVQQNQQKAE